MGRPQHGQIFTTEPLVMRAFAAELRYDRKAAGRLVAEALGEDLGPALSVRCEASELRNLDIVIEFGGAVVVGIEGKIGHRATEKQIAEERAAVDGRLILLVKDRDDVDLPAVPGEPPLSVITWRDALAHFAQSRITLDDIEAVDDRKRVARRRLRSIDTSALIGWQVEGQDGERGWPSITAFGPDLPDGKTLIMQVELVGRTDGEAYAATVGISVAADEFGPFDPSAADEECPAWIDYAGRIGQFLDGNLHGTTAEISPYPAATGRSGLGRSKIDQANHYGLDLRFAKGYAGDYLGVRTRRVDSTELTSFAEVLFPSLVALDARLR